MVCQFVAFEMTRTTVRLPDDLLERAQAHAARTGRTFTQLLADAREAVQVHGLEVAPVAFQQRAAFGHALTAGKTAPEYEPAGKASEEVSELLTWLRGQLLI